MKYVLIRDDDINCFTEKRFIETIYGPLLERDIPVNFSVIPHIDPDITYGKEKPLGAYYKKLGLTGSPAVPPQYRGKGESQRLEENRELTQYLLQFPHIEILQHGYDHGFIGNRSEFDICEKDELEKRIRKGKEILSQTFGREPNFFTAPRDSASRMAIHCLQKEFKGISIWRLFGWERLAGNFLRSLTQRRFSECLIPFQTFALHRKLKKRDNKPYIFIDDFLILTHPGCIFSRFSEPGDILSSVKEAIDSVDILTLNNHHWEYFFDWNELNEGFFAAWKKAISYLEERDDVTFLTFSELYQKLHPKSV